MTVSELIDQLSTVSPDAEVVFAEWIKVTPIEGIFCAVQASDELYYLSEPETATTVALMASCASYNMSIGPYAPGGPRDPRPFGA